MNELGVVNRRSVAIRTERTKEKLSQDDLAQILEVHKNSIQNWETGQVVPIQAHAMRLIDVLPGLRGLLPEGRDGDKGGPRSNEGKTKGESKQPSPTCDAVDIMRKAVLLVNALRGTDKSYGILRFDKEGWRALVVCPNERELEEVGDDAAGLSQKILDELRADAKAAREEAERRAAALKGVIE